MYHVSFSLAYSCWVVFQGMIPPTGTVRSYTGEHAERTARAMARILNHCEGAHRRAMDILARTLVAHTIAARTKAARAKTQ